MSNDSDIPSFPQNQQDYSGLGDSQGLTTPQDSYAKIMSIVEHAFDSESTVENIKNYLTGKSYEKVEKEVGGRKYYVFEWIKSNKDSEPLLNDKGISDILTKIRPYISPELKISKLSKEMINDKYLSFKRELIDDMFLQYDLYGLTENNYRSIINTISAFIHFSMFAVEDGRLLNKLVTNISERHEYSGMRPNQNQGWFSFLKKDNNGGQ